MPAPQEHAPVSPRCTRHLATCSDIESSPPKPRLGAFIRVAIRVAIRVTTGVVLRVSFWLQGFRVKGLGFRASGALINQKWVWGAYLCVGTFAASIV